MRLTLRTLLAYLDDILESSQAKEIGARISENSVASSLISRIRDVTRRRRIGSPDLTGPTATPDCNVIAEYLDNTLEPQAVADVEKVCLDSDMHLAEVAACHQILTIVLGEPVTIRPELRERMYALGSPADMPSPLVSAIPAPAPAAATVVPEYLKRPAASRRLLPWMIVAVLLGAWVWLIAKDGMLAGFLGRDVKQNVAAIEPPGGDQQDAPPLVDQDKATSTPDSKGSIEPGAESVAIAETPEVPDENILAPDNGTTEAPPAPTSDQAVAESQATNEEDIPLPPDPALDIAAAAEAAFPNEPITVPMVDEAGVAEAPALPAPTVMYTSTEGVLVYRSGDNETWRVLPRRALLHVGDEVACPEPFTAQLAVTSPGADTLTLQLQLSGNSRIRLLPATEESVIEVGLDRGRLGVFRPTDGLEKTLNVGLVAGDERALLELKTPGTRCGVLLERPQPPSPPPFEVAPRPTGTLFTVAGAVNIRTAEGKGLSGEAAPEWIEWTSPDAQFVVLQTIPVWLDPEARPLASTRSYMRTFEPEFLLDQPVRNSIPAVLNDRRPQISRLAAQALSLVDDMVDLAPALASDHEETRLVAIVGLREWVLANPENAERLRDLIGRSFRDDEADIIVQLIWGPSLEDARLEEPSMALVELMGSDNIAIRELAFFHVQRLTRKDMQYRPLNPQPQREAALLRWREYVKRNQGLIAAE
jgi:hypothetical protein